MNTLKSYFKVEERGSTIEREIISGVIIFVSMFYIVALQAGWMGPSLSAESGMSVASATATIGILVAITASLSTIFMGLYANMPLSLASGIGVGSFVAFTMTGGKMDLSYSAAMSAIMISGLIFIITSVTPARQKILNSIPDDMKKAISIGIGFFLLFIGLYNSGIIQVGGGTPTFVGKLSDPAILLALIGIFLTIILWLFDIKGGVLIAMIATIIIGLIFGQFDNWKSDYGYNIPSFDNVTWDNYGEAFSGMGNAMGRPFFGMAEVDSTWANPSWYLAIIVLFLNDFFDTAGTILGIDSAINKSSEEQGIEYRTDSKTDSKILLVDSTSTFVGSMFGTTNVTVFAESNAGIQYGARTGLASLVCGGLFILSIPLIPLLTPLFTSAITAGAIVMIGIMMAALLKQINVEDKVLLVSTVFTIIFMILGYSIGTGIVAGLLTYVILMIITNRFNELDITLLATTPLFLAFIILPLVI